MFLFQINITFYVIDIQYRTIGLFKQMFSHIILIDVNGWKALQGNHNMQLIN